MLAAERFGKHKTISQIVAILSILVQHCYQEAGPAGELIFGFDVFGRPWVEWFAPAALWVAVILTLASGAIYLWRNRAALSVGSMKLWIAQGFGIGRIPFAPGTFGSLLGLGWLALLLCGKSWLLIAAGRAAGLALSVWLCGEGEKLLNQKDPGSVVLDEIAAMPVCFVAAMTMVYCRQKQWPGPEYFFSAAHGLVTAGIFVLFRVFDIRQAVAGAAEPGAARRMGDYRG